MIDVKLIKTRKNKYDLSFETRIYNIFLSNYRSNHYLRRYNKEDCELLLWKTNISYRWNFNRFL